MRSRTFFIASIFSIVFFALPVVAYAGGIPFFGPIIPQGANEAVCPASWGMLITVINNIISLLLTLAILFLAPIMIAYAGFLYVVNPTSIGDIGKANKILQNTAIGIVVALSAWLVVDAVMAVLYNSGASDQNGGVLGTWSSLVTGNSNDKCLTQRGALPSETLNQANLNNTVNVVPKPNGGTAGSAGDELYVRQQFKDAGVSINREETCSLAGSLCGGVTSPCTNVGGMRTATIEQIIYIAKQVNTVNNHYVEITGGTEPGHACGNGDPAYSHREGYKVDLKLTQVLGTYIQNMTQKGTRGEDPIYEDTCGNQYVLEDNHWDITVYKSYCANIVY